LIINHIKIRLSVKLDDLLKKWFLNFIDKILFPLKRNEILGKEKAISQKTGVFTQKEDDIMINSQDIFVLTKSLFLSSKQESFNTGFQEKVRT